MFKKRSLDVDLVVDRTPELSVEAPVLDIPDDIRGGETAKITILNYDPALKYEVTVSEGTVSVNGPIIEYNAPASALSNINMKIKAYYEDLNDIAIFDNGTAFDSQGNIRRLTKIKEGEFSTGKKLIKFSDLETNEVEPVKPPVPSRKPKSELHYKDFNISEKFGSLGNKDIKDKTNKIGKVADYYVPEQKDKRPDDEKYLYKVNGNKFISIPRNSNVAAASFGDVFGGYAKPGEPGSSLSVFKRHDYIPQEFDYQFEVSIIDLSAVLPSSILALCISELEIKPVLRGFSEGHYFEWEQISGDTSTVVWLSDPTDINLHIQLGSVRTDRTFRFWISRGMPYEKFYDVSLLGTPTDTMYTAANKGFKDGRFGIRLNTHNRKTTPLLLSYDNIWNKQLRIDVIRNY